MISMKRAKLGDVYAFKTDRGYRTIHWAYKVEKIGKYVRVFSDFYQEKPNSLKDIIDGECDYIIGFNISLLYQKGLLELWDNIPVSDNYPLPTYSIFYHGDSYGFYNINLFCNNDSVETIYGDCTGSVLPEKYRDLNFLDAFPSPIWFIYLLHSDFDTKHWNLYWPRGGKADKYEKIYGDILFGPKKET